MTDRPATPPMFVNATECSRLLGIAETSWPAVRRKWAERGFPKPNPETGKYLWPAVKAWVFKDNGFDANLVVAEGRDGEEHWP